MIEVKSFAKIIDEALNINGSLYNCINYKKGYRSGIGSSMSESDIKKKDMIERMNAWTDSYDKQRVLKEQEWRHGLKVGDYIDALNLYATP